MIVLLVCHCYGAELKARRFLQDHGVRDWLSVPLYRGKVDCQNFLKSLPSTAEGPDTIESLQSFLARAGGFVVIVGYDDQHFMWSNIKTSSLKVIADAEIIVEQFA